MSEKALGFLPAWHVYDPRSNELPAPSVGIFDFPRICVPINVEWIAHVAGVIGRLEWEDAWSGTDEEKYTAIQEIMKLWDYFQNGKCEAMLRQSPDNPCVWQQSLDGGQTWENVFDLEKCKHLGSTYTTTEYITIHNNNQTTINNDNTTYAGDITNITNNWGYDGGAIDGDRDTAMCYAIKQIIDLVCDIMIKQIEDGNAAFKDGADLFSDVEFALAGLSGSLFALGIAVSATGIGAVALAATGILTSVLGYALQENTDAFTDEDAKDAIRCKIYNAMAGSTPTFAAWSGALTENGDVLNDVMYAFMQDQDLFVQWLIAVDDVIPVADQVTNECLECLEWDITADFTISDYGFQQATVVYGHLCGEYVPGSGWEQQRVDTVTGAACELPIGVDTTITYLRMRYDFQSGLRWDGTTDGDNLVMLGSEAYAGVKYKQDLPDTEKHLTWEGNADVLAADVLKCMVISGIAFDGKQPTEYGSVRIYKVRLKGTGTKPTWGVDTPEGT